MPASFFALVRYALYGVLMGGADVIPGVSGGTMALIVGIYERLVRALSSFVSFGLAFVRLDFGSAREHLRSVPWRFLLPLLAGIGMSIVVGARIIPGLMERHPASMRGLFFGLVAASLLIPIRRIEQPAGRHVTIGVACAVGAFLLTGLPALSVPDPGLVRVFLTAAVAICAMILPGVSGAFLLEALGIYAPTLRAVHQLEWAYVCSFGLGAAVGLATFAKLLDYLLARRHDATMAALVGLIAGALRALWPYGGAARALRLPTANEPVVSVVLLTLAGFGAVLVLIYLAPSSSHNGAPSI